MPRKLTDRTIENIKPSSKRQEIADELLPGHYFIVQPSGAKSFAIRYRTQDGRTRKHTLDPYPAIKLKIARDLGRAALRAVAEGRDPAAEKAQARARTAEPDTVAAVTKLFIERHVLLKNRPTHAVETQRLLNKHIVPRWRNRLLRDLKRRDVLDLLDELIAAGTPITANRTLAALRKMLNWACDREIIEVPPTARVKPPSAEHSRDRVLDDAELRNVWNAADQLGYPFGPVIKLLILTGQRRGEVAGMRWSEIDAGARPQAAIRKEHDVGVFQEMPAGGLWTLPPGRTKNAQGHRVPLSPAALDVLASLPRIDDSDFVFTADGLKPVSGFSKAKQQLTAFLSTDMAPWVLHDLRRSTASGMARIGVGLPTVERLLNHKSGSFAGVAGVYQKHEFAVEMRAAVDAWGRHVLALDQRSNVVPLRG